MCIPFKGTIQFIVGEPLFSKLNPSTRELVNMRWRFGFAAGYFIIGLAICVASYFFWRWPFLPLVPTDNAVGASRRLAWCFGSSLIGFSLAAVYSLRSSKGTGKKTPFPAYITYYPLFLIVDSLFVFGFLHLFNKTKTYLFYPFATWAGVNLGFFIDNVRFDHFLETAIEKAAKWFTGEKPGA